MKAVEMKALTGAKYWQQAVSILCDRIKKRTWTYNGDEAKFGGYDHRKGLVHFCICKSAGPNCASFRRIGLSMGDALDCLSGTINPNEAEILF